MFKDKKFKLFIAFLALFICISQLKDTYAKYLEAKEGNTDFTIANWKIVVNDKDISEGSTMASLITVEGVGTISNTINYTATKKNIVMRVYFKWIDDDTGVMDNKADTKASIDGNNAKLKVNLSFTQVV